MGLTNYLDQLVTDRNNLVTALTDKGVAATQSEKLRTLVAKVGDITVGGGTRVVVSKWPTGEEYETVEPFGTSTTTGYPFENIFSQELNYANSWQATVTSSSGSVDIGLKLKEPLSLIEIAVYSTDTQVHNPTAGYVQAFSETTGLGTIRVDFSGWSSTVENNLLGVIKIKNRDARKRLMITFTGLTQISIGNITVTGVKPE